MLIDNDCIWMATNGSTSPEWKGELIVNDGSRILGWDN